MRTHAIEILVSICAVVLVACFFLFVPGEAEVRDFAMNTTVSIRVKAPNARKAASMALDEVRRLEKLMSSTLPSSDVSRLNRAETGTYVRLSDEVYDIIEYSLYISRLTGGAFDITTEPLSRLWDTNAGRVPGEGEIEQALGCVGYESVALNPKDKSAALLKDGMKIGLGAIAKGYAADRIKDILRNQGVKEALIDLGGNIYVMGRSANIGLQTPFEPRGETFEVLEVRDMAVVTSGSYERYFEKDGTIYHHIIDPKTGSPARSGIHSVSVIAQSACLADALSTAVFVGGEDAALPFEGVRLVIYTADGRIIKTENS